MSKNIDTLLKVIIHEQIDNIVPPPKEEVWERLKLKINSHKDSPKKRSTRLKLILAVCITLAILAMTPVIFYTPVKAFTINIIRSIEKISGKLFVIHKKIGFDDNNQDNKSEDNRSDDPRIDKARSEVSFEILAPNYIPKDYELYTIDVFNKNKEMEQVTLIYINTKDDKKKEAFEIVMQSSPMGSESRMNYILEPDTEIDHIELKGIECTLLTYNENYNVLFWDRDNLSYKIDGAISKKDIIKIADSMSIFVN